ncbi:MAG TPA: HAD family phosphatase, partial [Candidatus Cloacimonas sp.]|nr:HAD family phosphatase [Candidatus Cloacimonas sp.]
MQMLICDWDGTLYQNNRLEKKLLRQLQVLGDRNVVRAVATGRNLFSARKVISPEFPIDYL